MALELPATIAAAVLNIVASLYLGYRQRRIRQRDRERTEFERKEAFWRKQVDEQLENHRSALLRLEGPARIKLGVDLRLDK